jgi:hypothetical protein
VVDGSLVAGRGSGSTPQDWGVAHVGCQRGHREYSSCCGQYLAVEPQNVRLHALPDSAATEPSGRSVV